MCSARARRGPLSLALAAAFLLRTPAASAAWTVTAIEDVRSFDRSSLSFDPVGRPAIAYGASSLYYASWIGSGWTVETVESGCTGERGPSLAFAADVPVVSFHDDAGALRISRRFAGTWIAETIDATVVAGGATSLAIDRGGLPAVAYHDQTNHDLRYARFDGLSWIVTTVDGATAEVGEYPSLALDPSGQPAISYFDQTNRDLKLARFDGSVWQLRVVDGLGDVGAWTSLAFDPAGIPAIAYHDGTNVLYAHWNGSAWDREEVAASSGNGSYGLSLGFDGAGVPTIAFPWNSGISHLAYAQRDPVDDGWSLISDADLGWLTGNAPSLAFDPAGNPGISHLDRDNGALKFTTLGAVGFRSEFVDGQGPSGDSGGSVAFDRSANLGVSYWGGVLGGLRYAAYDGTSWAIDMVDPGFWIGYASSLLFDGSGNPLVAYDDRGAGNLKLARRSGATWTLQSVASAPLDPTAPMFPSLALDPAGNPAISYHWYGPSPDFHLNFARWAGSSWAIETVESVVDFPFDGATQLAFDGAGNPGIAYRKSGQIRFAAWNGTAWDRQVVDPAPGIDPFVAVDGAGAFLVAYHEPTAGSVKLARRVGSAWQSELVAPGRPTGLSLDSTGNPAIAFTDLGLGRARLLRWDGTRWSSELVNAGGAAGDLAIDPGGSMAVVIRNPNVCLAPQIALNATTIAVTVHRGVVVSLLPGWQASALPLTSANDDQTPPFPVTAPNPSNLTDAATPPVPLVLYRVLLPGDADAGNILRAARSGNGVFLSF